MARIRLERIAKRFGDGKPVLEGVDLTVADGELVTLVGPSGCGKSTLLNVVAGLESPSSGRVLVDDVDVTTKDPGDRDMAMVFQSYALYPHMTVAKNIAFPLENRRMPRAEIEGRVQKTAARLEIGHLLDRKPKALSGGQRQRVALARALVRSPKLFLFDEPLSNLDAALRMQMRVELKKLHAELNATFLYVTHDQVEAMTLSDRVVVLSGGRVQQVGSPRAIYDAPANVFVAGFFGAPPINLLAPEVLGLVRAGAQVGVRPEDVEVGLGEGPEGSTPGRVAFVEPVGPESYVTVELGASRVTARAPATFEAAHDAPAWVRARPERLHWFDAASGVRLS